MPSAIINVMDRAARKAGRALVRDFGEVEQLQVSKKGAADFVSAADLKAERVLRQELNRARPEFAFLGEEGGIQGESRDRWVVDPLDGTSNFLHGIPHFAISIALELDGQVVAGAIFEPLSDQFYWAEKGAGAFLGNSRLRVSARTRMAEAIIATGIPHLGMADHERYLKGLTTLMGEVAGIRRFGAAALDMAYVAAGRFDGFWEFGLNRWDLAAGELLVHEAGGFVSDIAGGNAHLDTGNIVAANANLHGDLIGILKSFDSAAAPTPAAAQPA